MHNAIGEDLIAGALFVPQYPSPDGRVYESLIMANLSLLWLLVLRFIASLRVVGIYR